MSIIRSSMTLKQSIVVCRRHFSYGSLPGGFSKEALQQWAMNEWGITAATGRRRDEEEEEMYLPCVDLFSQKISADCVSYLNGQDNHDQHLRQHQHPSSELTKCYLSSTHFLPERLILTVLFSIFGSSMSTSTSTKNVATQLPTSFLVGTQYFGWTVAAQSPLEIICTWELSATIKGCTMIAYDPALRRVYHGNCIYPSSFISDVSSKEKKNNESWSNLFGQSVLIPLHVHYAKFLLSGMVKEVERRARDCKKKMQ